MTKAELEALGVGRVANCYFCNAPVKPDEPALQGSGGALSHKRCAEGQTRREVSGLEIPQVPAGPLDLDAIESVAKGEHGNGHLPAPWPQTALALIRELREARALKTPAAE